MALKILFFILFFNLIKNERFNDDNCHKNLIDSYNLNSYLKPRTVNMYICPKLKLTCCSIYDQFLMFTNWRDNVSKNLKRYYTGLYKKTIALYRLMRYVDRMDLNVMLAKINLKKVVKAKVKNLLLMNKINKVTKNVRKLINFQKKSNQFMLKMHSTFYCSICDFENHAYFHEEDKTLTLDQGTCQAIVKNTLAHSYFLNIKILPNLFRYSTLLSYFNPDDSRPPTTLRGFKKIRTDITKCSAVKPGASYKPCFNYCKYFRFNSNSPVLEGYQSFINEIIMDITIFIKHNREEKPYKKKKRRGIARVLSLVKENSSSIDSLIEKNKNIPIFSKMPKKKNFSSFSQIKKNQNTKLTQNINYFPKDKKPVPRSLMQKHNFSPLKFDSKYFIKRPNVYIEKHQDPEFNDTTINKMTQWSNKYNKQKQINFVNFIKNKLHFSDIDYDYENPNREEIFNTSPKTVVDLENFETNIKSNGINIIKHLNTKIGSSLKDLLGHMKEKSKFKIGYEKIDNEIITQINDISNGEVSKFHRDNFLGFKNFGGVITKGNIMRNYDNIKKNARIKGYYIKV